jgi:hypothetical protein
MEGMNNDSNENPASAGGKNSPENKPKGKRKSNKGTRAGAIRPEIEQPLAGQVLAAIDMVNGHTGMKYSPGKFLTKCLTEKTVQEVAAKIIKAFDAV